MAARRGSAEGRSPDGGSFEEAPSSLVDDGSDLLVPDSPAAPPDTGDPARSPPEIPAPGWWRITLRVWQAVTGNALWIHCGCVGFFGFLSVFPILGIFVLLYGILFDPTAMAAQIEPLRPVVPAEVFQLINVRLSELTGNETGELTLGLAITLGVASWTGSRGTNAMIDLLNLAYHEEVPRSFVRRLALAVGLTVGGLVAVIVILFTVAAIPLLARALPVPELAQAIAIWGRWPVLAVIIFLGLLLLYRFAPNRRYARWRWLLPGAALASALWMLLSFAFSFYVERFDVYGATFGTLSVAAVMMLWIYYSALVIGLGAIVNAETELQTRYDSTVGPDRPLGKRGAVVADNLPPGRNKREPA
jgi:membrane protein